MRLGRPEETNGPNQKKKKTQKKRETKQCGNPVYTAEREKAYCSVGTRLM